MTERDRSDMLIRAIYYNLLTQKEIKNYCPHFLMFGRFLVLTAIHTRSNQWRIFNRSNFKSLYDSLERKLESYYYENNIEPKDVYEMIYPDRGIFSNLSDPIPEELFLLGIRDVKYTVSKYDLSSLILCLVPQWMNFYSNLRLFRYTLGSFYNNGFEQVSMKEIRKVEGYDDYDDTFQSQYYQGCKEEDYSMYKV